jgi:myo-inositol 2-dehydrogenase/D-chiro-inositol 1-dehydrogenase
VLTARKNSLASDHLTDPVLFIFDMAGGALVDVEASINIQYAYDIRGEVVGESGTVELAETNRVVVKKAGGFTGRVPDDWRERFIRAYDAEFAEWIAAAARGESTGPSSWDGYAATVVCAAGLEAMERGGERVAVSLGEKPALYGSGGRQSGPLPDVTSAPGPASSSSRGGS